MEFTGGWDSAAALVDGRWVERRPRHPRAEILLRRETHLMSWLAPRLPVPVPVPWVAQREPLVVRHELVPGEPFDPSVNNRPAVGLIGHQLGEFLRALHATPVDAAVRHGLASAAEVRRERAELLERFRTEVVPLLPGDRKSQALDLLESASDARTDTVVHGDLGPEHILTDGRSLTGVIDFGDAHIGDRALDLAWALHGAPSGFAHAVGTAYGVTDALREGALLWHRLGPWHEVLHGLDTATPELVRTGVGGVLSRL
ncbi:phosphotransferase family protein [Mycobacterium talmoniae]|uniref:Aminoglycoside phosphotransferase n=1 Tax=Mycobacterium talmoniae TaxID=1858794 RepID=A0A1S1MM59_9MYCO|nr:phosphotransferase [Mycobacterium talmoniae]OHU85681.1 aminoglycoside phosphotransferase [Mycobacterium talmoniae]